MSTATETPPALHSGDSELHTHTVAALFAHLVDNDELTLPQPGAGRTRERWQALTALAEQDLALARLAEGHTDALAIIRELDPAGSCIRPEPGQRWGVWAAEPPGTGLSATPTDTADWLLSGTKAYCSGARSCTNVLVTASAGPERRLFAVDLSLDAQAVRPIPGSWPGVGMVASDTLDTEFDQVVAVPLGGDRAYLDRPGFHHGSIGVAACWYGGARAVLRTLHMAADHYDVGPHALAHLGFASAELEAVRTQLDSSAAAIDADPLDSLGEGAVRSKQVKAFTEAVCSDVLARVGRALGAAPLAHDDVHARAVADLTVYLRQHHGERDYAALGEAVAHLPWAGQ